MFMFQHCGMLSALLCISLLPVLTCLLCLVYFGYRLFVMSCRVISAVLHGSCLLVIVIHCVLSVINKRRLLLLLLLLSVCLSHLRSRKLSEIGAKFHYHCRKSGLPSKNMKSDFAPEVARYLKSSPKPQNSAK